MIRSTSQKKPRFSAAFSLVEILVAIAILSIMLVLVSQMIAATGKVFKNVSAKIDAFQAARDGFEMMTDQLRQATLNTYWDYFDANGYTVLTTSNSSQFTPVSYGRQSELQFISGPVSNASLLGGMSPPLPSGATALTHAVFFQCPLDYNQTAALAVLNKLLNATGFYVEFGPDYDSSATNMAMAINGQPLFTTQGSGYTPKYRCRLMQLIQPTENFSVYSYPTANTWFTNPLTYTTTLFGTTVRPNVRIVADNIIGLFIWPKINDTDTPSLTTMPLTTANFLYDSRNGNAAWKPSATNPQPLNMNQLPPIVEVAMIAIDEPSAKVLQGTSKTLPSQITTAYAANNPATGVQYFTVPANLDSDLEHFETVLAGITPKVNFRTFSTTLAVRSAKFSTN